MVTKISKHDPQNLELEIDTDEGYEFITLSMKSINPDRTIVVGFNVQEAQVLNSMLSDAIANLLLHKLGITPLPPETRH